MLVEVAVVGEQEVGLLSGPADLAGDRVSVQLIKQWDQLGDVVAVAAGQGDRQRDARRVDQQVVALSRSGGDLPGTVSSGAPQKRAHM